MNATPTTIEVPKPLNPDQVAAYLESGYVLLPGLLDTRKIHLLRDESLKFARGEYAIENSRPLPPEVDDETALRRVSTVYSGHHVSDTIFHFIQHPQICGVISQLAAAHRRYWDGSAKFVQSCLFMKPPGMRGHAWHQDDRSIQTWDQSLCAAWIAIDDTTTDNGCLWVVPGSHRTGYLYPLRPHQQSERYDFSNEAYGFEAAGAVPLECRAGTVLFFSGSLLHSSQPNRTASCRRVLANHYCNAWSELPYYDVEQQRQVDLRSVIPVAGIDPYAWKGYTPMPASVYVRYADEGAF
jgi:ectoine hydroxylase-related dioxygenase (phytanoyl-CoA dioxygenase family)